MSIGVSSAFVGFEPTHRVLERLGTNGHLSTWGAILAGTSPRSIVA